MTVRATPASLCRLACKLAAIALTALGCNIPVHVTQSSHVLIYNQRFAICNNQSRLRKHLIDDVLGLLPEYAPPEKDIEKIIILGSVYFRVVSVPGDPSSFTIEGHGWHRMYYGMTDDKDAREYLASADFWIANDGPIYLDELRHMSLVIRVIVSNKSYFATPYLTTTRGVSEVFLRIFLRELAEDVYTFDFDRPQIVGIRLPIALDAQERIQPIGYMQFIPPGDERNLWDFRRIIPIATDYAGMMARRIGAPQRQPASRAVEWLPELSCPDPRKGAL
jgi:hypothetical protein